MATKYLYIDDDKMAHGIVKNIENEDLLFNVQTPTNWNEQIELLLDEKTLNDYDGLLLDLKLEFSNNSDEDQHTEDDHASAENQAIDKTKLVKFSGADLAQRIRTEVKANKEIVDLPIFLCSTDKVFMSFYDKTSYDLFDKKFNKNVDFEASNLTTDTFIRYAEAYKDFSKSHKIEDYLKKELNDDEDLNILALELLKCDTPHEKIYLLDRFFLQKSGILADEELVAIRLGIDIKTSPDWNKFLETELDKFKYKGILGELYPRWWIQDLAIFFKSEFDVNLKILDSKDRVVLITEQYKKYNLNSLTLLEHHEFSTYWYKCVLSGLPLDILDGLKIVEIPRYPWIEQSFISKNYLLSDERDKEKILSVLGPNEKLIFNELE